MVNLRSQISHLPQHILNENAVPCGGVVYKHVGDRSDKLAVLNNGAAAHECGQEGTTAFHGHFEEKFLSVENKKLIVIPKMRSVAFNYINNFFCRALCFECKILIGRLGRA